MRHQVLNGDDVSKVCALQGSQVSIIPFQSLSASLPQAQPERIRLNKRVSERKRLLLEGGADGNSSLLRILVCRVCFVF